MDIPTRSNSIESAKSTNNKFSRRKSLGFNLSFSNKSFDSPIQSDILTNLTQFCFPG